LPAGKSHFMDHKFLFHRIRYFILSPGNAWQIVHSENRPLKDVRNSFFFPLIIAVALSATLGSLFFTHNGLSVFYSLLIGIKYFLLFYILIYLSTYLFSEITKALDLGKDFVISFKVITYSMAPLLICQIMSRLFESLIFVNILALYGLYIFWVGIERMLNPPEHKKMPILIATTVSIILILFGTNWLLSTLLDRIYFSFFG
jgi:hypothetical protein